MRCAVRQQRATIATFRAVEQAAVQKILEDARAAVEGAGTPQDLRAVAFEKAVDLLGGLGSASIGVAPVAPATPKAAQAPAAPRGGDAQDKSLAKVAEKLDLDM